MLHPQARALLDLIEEKGVPPPHTLAPADARRCTRNAAPSPSPSRRSGAGA